MASVPLPANAPPLQCDAVGQTLDPLQRRLRETYRIEVPIIPWPDAHSRVLRVSVQAYNDWEEYETLARVLEEGDGREGEGAKITQARW